MRIIDRYINRSITIIFITSVLIFCFLYVLIDSTMQLDEFIDRKVPLEIIFRYYLNFIPIILVQTSPIACLIATLFTFSGMNHNNEVVAMRSSGMSFWQITKPAIYFGLIISMLIFWVNERYVPQASAATQKIRDENMILYVDRLIKKMAIKNLTFYGLKNRLYFIDSFDVKNDSLKGITIIEYNQNQNIEKKIVAFKGIWTGIAWKFYNCQVTTYETDGINTSAKVKIYKEKLMDIKESPKDFLRQRLNVTSMNIIQLKEYIDRFANSGATKAINNLRVDLHQKIAFPFGNFVIILIGLPFALMVKSRKGMTFASLGIAIMLGFLFYVTNAVSIAFGKGGFFPPIFAAWSAPCLFSLIGIMLIKTDFTN